ncbi:MAG: hypothetical protein ACK5YA_01265 [bacterium]|jgi:hypothetical protein
MFYEMYVNNKWKRYKSDKKIEINYAEKQNNANYHYKKQDNTYFFEGDDAFIPIEVPKRYLSLFKLSHPNAKTMIRGESFIITNAEFKDKLQY